MTFSLSASSFSNAPSNWSRDVLSELYSSTTWYCGYAEAAAFFAGAAAGAAEASGSRSDSDKSFATCIYILSHLFVISTSLVQMIAG